MKRYSVPFSIGAIREVKSETQKRDSVCQELKGHILEETLHTIIDKHVAQWKHFTIMVLKGMW